MAYAIGWRHAKEGKENENPYEADTGCWHEYEAGYANWIGANERELNDELRGRL